MIKLLAAYIGDEPSVFVCYSHTDTAEVYPEIKRLQEAGANVRYDEGISPGQEWTQEIADAIDRASSVIFFVSPASVESQHCRNEIQYASTRSKQIVSIHLTQTEIPGGLELTIGLKQAILKYNLREDDYQRKLTDIISGSVPASETPGRNKEIPAQRGRSVTAWVLGALVLVGLVSFLFWFQQSSEPESVPLWQQNLDEPQRLVVLPFQQHGESPIAGLSQSVSEAISNGLNQLDSITLVSSQSAFLANQQSQDVREIGQSLDVTFVVSGDVYVQGTETRTSISIVETREAEEILSQEYRATLEDAQALYAYLDQVAEDIGRTSSLLLERDTPYFNPVLPPTGDLEAYNLARNANFAFRQQDPRRAIELANAALEIDPDYTLAHLYAALAWFGLGEGGAARDGFYKAKVHADKMVELSPEFGSGYQLQGLLTSRLEWDFPKAMALLTRARNLGTPPEFVDAEIANLYFNTGQYEEALALFKRVVQANPLGGAEFLIARTLSRMGRFDEATDMYQQLIADAGPQDSVLLDYAFVHFADHEPDLADAMLQQNHPALFASARAYLAAIRGDPSDRIQQLKSAIANREHTYVNPKSISLGSYVVGLYEQHIEWWKVVVEEKSGVHFMYDDLYGMRTNYWATLEAWAADDPDDQPRREKILAEHKALIDRVMSKMKL